MKIEKKLLSILLVLVMAITLVPMFGVEAWAETPNVCENTYTTTSYSSIQEAINNVTTGQTIKLTTNVAITAGALNITSGKEFTLDLNGYVLQQTTNASVIYNQGNLTIIDSNPTARHYFAYSTQAAWTYTGDTGNSTTTPGGINDNTASGASILVEGGVITGGKGRYNNYGGGICNDSGTISVNGISIVGNTASYGGGIYNYYGTITISGSSIVGNAVSSASGEVYGGGIDNYQGSITMSKVTVSYNKAVSVSHNAFGGGIFNQGSITMNTVTIEDINASGVNVYGGGIFNYEGSMNINDVTIGEIAAISSSSYAIGGGICNYGSITMSAVTIENITVSNRKGKVDGGGIYNGENYFIAMSEVTMENITAISEVEVVGGGISNYGSMTTDVVTVKGVTSIGSKVWGGGICNGCTSASLTISGALIADNKASSAAVYGVGICQFKGSLNMSGSVTVSDNTINDTISSNIYICSGQSITADNLSAGSSIGITTEYAPTNTAKVKFASGTNINKDCFFSDNSDYTIKSLTNALYLAVKESDEEEVKAADKFADVEENTYYYDAVNWAVENDITDGVDSTHFNPSGITTRAQMVTFLWRAAGSPVVNYAMPFTDVPEDMYYTEAVRWAVSLGITNGTSDTTFSPYDNVTRGQTVAFLWRYEGSAVQTGSNPFVDVPSWRYYYNAVLWAKENEVTDGTSANKFSPDDPCTRGQIVTFLYRDMVE